MTACNAELILFIFLSVPWYMSTVFPIRLDVVVAHMSKATLVSNAMKDPRESRATERRHPFQPLDCGCLSVLLVDSVVCTTACLAAIWNGSYEQEE
jgi:hypothetical protein